MEVELEIEFSGSDFEDSSSESSQSSNEDVPDPVPVDPAWHVVDDTDETDIIGRNFVHETGPSHNLPSDATPLDYFSLFGMTACLH